MSNKEEYFGNDLKGKNKLKESIQKITQKQLKSLSRVVKEEKIREIIGLESVLEKGNYE